MATAVLAGALLLAGCTASDGVAGSYSGGDYTSGDGATRTFAAKNRGAAVEYTATEADGSTIRSSDLRGKVVVLNFWYAQCGPCIAEAPRLQRLNEKFGDGRDDVQFLGVNLNDGAPQATEFATAHKVTYPTTIETGHNSPMRFAFAGKVSPNTTPTTLVIDRQGRVAARFSGEITTDQESVLSEIIQSTLDEKGS